MLEPAYHLLERLYWTLLFEQRIELVLMVKEKKLDSWMNAQSATHQCGQRLLLMCEKAKKKKSHHSDENFVGSTDVRLVEDILMEKVILSCECFVEKGVRNSA